MLEMCAQCQEFKLYTMRVRCITFGKYQRYYSLVIQFSRKISIFVWVLLSFFVQQRSQASINLLLIAIYNVYEFWV
jgi:hypothetical protein